MVVSCFSFVLRLWVGELVFGVGMLDGCEPEGLRPILCTPPPFFSSTPCLKMTDSMISISLERGQTRSWEAFVCFR